MAGNDDIPDPYANYSSFVYETGVPGYDTDNGVALALLVLQVPCIAHHGGLYPSLFANVALFYVAPFFARANPGTGLVSGPWCVSCCWDQEKS